MAVRSLKNENVFAFSHQLCSMESYLGKEISRRRSCHFSRQVFSKRFQQSLFLSSWLLKISLHAPSLLKCIFTIECTSKWICGLFRGDFLLNPASLRVCCFSRLLKYWIFFTPGRHFPLMGTVSNEINKTAIKISEAREEKEWSRVSETLFHRRAERMSKTKASENSRIGLAKFLNDFTVCGVSASQPNC